MTKFINLTGQKFGRLTIIKRAHDKGQQTMWLCQCSCKSMCVVNGYNLRKGNTKSCGCFRREITKNLWKRSSEEYRESFRSKFRTHRLSRTRAYTSWYCMIRRCDDPLHKYFYNYGKRGIKVCERWYEIKNFYKDMGERPKGLSLETIGNNKGYSKNNCKWSTRKEQANNRRPRGRKKK